MSRVPFHQDTLSDFLHSIDPNWTLRGTAAAFQPTTSANKDLLNDSTPDDGPLIVSSQAIHAPTTAKSPAVERNAQKPIGTPGAEVSDRRVCVHFTTDNCPDCPKRAGHYVIIKVNMDLYVNMFEMLSQDVSWISVPPHCDTSCLYLLFSVLTITAVRVFRQRRYWVLCGNRRQE